jgi:hypothetical protein
MQHGTFKPLNSIKTGQILANSIAKTASAHCPGQGGGIGQAVQGSLATSLLFYSLKIGDARHPQHLGLQG